MFILGIICGVIATLAVLNWVLSWMTVEYSPGYIEVARRRLEEMEARMSPQMLAVSRGLSEHFAQASTPQKIREGNGG